MQGERAQLHRSRDGCADVHVDQRIDESDWAAACAPPTVSVERTPVVARQLLSWTRHNAAGMPERVPRQVDPTPLPEALQPGFSLRPSACMAAIFPTSARLVFENHVDTAIACAAFLGVVAGHRFVFAEADARDAIGGHARGDQRGAHGVCATL